MPQSWTHLIRFIANEDHQIHLGQLVNPGGDVGLDSLNGRKIEAYLVMGTIFDGVVTKTRMTVKQLLSPVSQEECGIIRCIGLNYKDHAGEANMVLPTAPVLFIKPRTALASPYPSALNIPKCAQDETADYEAELCVVISKTGRDISQAEAPDYVLGYTASNDVSARRLQFETSQWSFAKGLDNSCPIGPVLISPKGLPDPHKVSVKAIYNNEVVQEGNTKDLIFTVPELIAHLSKGTTLEAGSLILTGTPAGIGYFKKPRLYLEHEGDIRVEIGGGIGTLINKVRYEDF